MRVLVKNDRVVGVALVRPIFESILALDPKLSKRDKAKLLKEIMSEGTKISKTAGISEWHSFVNSDFGKILKKRFKYENCKGEALILRF